VAAQPDVVFSDQSWAVAAIKPAIEQVFDALGFDLQRPHLLPEAIAARAISPHELGIDQLLAQQQHEGLLFVGVAVDGGCCGQKTAPRCNQRYERQSHLTHWSVETLIT
jgi:hypothetical protein